MRAIKFRAYSKSNKRMDYNPSCEAEPAPLTHIVLSWVINEIQKDQVIMQFTGLKDKNGDIEVYECDIIDADGNVIGNLYETPNLHKDKANLVIQGFGTKDWLTTYQKAMDRGLRDA